MTRKENGSVVAEALSRDWDLAMATWKHRQASISNPTKRPSASVTMLPLARDVEDNQNDSTMARRARFEKIWKMSTSDSESVRLDYILLLNRQGRPFESYNRGDLNRSPVQVQAQTPVKVMSGQNWAELRAGQA